MFSVVPSLVPGPPEPGQNGHWCSETKSTWGSPRKISSVPFPWWTSKSTIATRRSPSSDWAWRAAMATLLKMQKPIASDSSAWWPGGRTSAKPSRSTAAIEQPAASRAASHVVGSAYVSGSSHNSSSISSIRSDVRVRVHSLDLLARRRPALYEVGKAFVKNAEPLRDLVVAVPSGRMQSRQRCVADHVHVAASSKRPASLSMPELADVRRRRRPVGHDVGEVRKRRRALHRRDLAVEPERVRLGREASGVEERVERSVLREELRGLLRADPACPGDPVGRVAAERDEVRDLLRVDAVAFAHLRRPDPRGRLASHGLQDRRPGARQLERVPVGRRDEHRAARLLLSPYRGAEEVVGLVPRRLRVREPGRRDERGHQRELLEQLVLELPTALVRLERLVAVGRDLERVPGHEHVPRPLVLPQPEEHVGEPEEHVPGAAVRAPDRLRDRVIRAMREGVAVHDEQCSHRSDSSSSSIAACSRSVATREASSTPFRSPSSSGVP